MVAGYALDGLQLGRYLFSRLVHILGGLALGGVGPPFGLSGGWLVEQFEKADRAAPPFGS